MTQLHAFEPALWQRASTMDWGEDPAEHPEASSSIGTVMVQTEPLRHGAGLSRHEPAPAAPGLGTVPSTSRCSLTPVPGCASSGRTVRHTVAYRLVIVPAAATTRGAPGLSVSSGSWAGDPGPTPGAGDPRDARLAAAVTKRPGAPRVAVARADVTLAAAHALSMEPARVAVTRSSCVALTFARDRRYAIFECDADGDVVLTLTDRTREDEEADTSVVGQGEERAHLERAARFLEG